MAKPDRPRSGCTARTSAGSGSSSGVMRTMRPRSGRSAFASALKDPELKVEAEKRSYELGPVAGEDMERLAKEVMAQPPAVIDRMKKVLGN